jgi:hypothetical protein
VLTVSSPHSSRSAKSYILEWRSYPLALFTSDLLTCDCSSFQGQWSRDYVAPSHSSSSAPHSREVWCRSWFRSSERLLSKSKERFYNASAAPEHPTTPRRDEADSDHSCTIQTMHSPFFSFLCIYKVAFTRVSMPSYFLPISCEDGSHNWTRIS